MIPYARQDIDEADIEAVVAALRSDLLTQGPVVPAFERAIAELSGVRHAVAVNSGTSALHVACLALGVGKGDRVWTSPITFVASANCALYCGASVDFVDIDPRSYNLSVSCLAEKLEQARRTHQLPKVVIPVHFCGQSCDMAAIHALSREYGFRIIEDASHAIGGRYREDPVGRCRYSDITLFSFHPVKIITTGEGGVAVTNDGQLAHAMRMLRSHGITSDPGRMLARPLEERWNYQQVALGFNYRLTDVAAALGLSQLRRLDAFLARRRELAARYDQLLAQLPIVLPWQHADTTSSYHLYPIRLKLDEIVGGHPAVFDGLQAKGINVNLHYIPVHRQPYYEQLGFTPGYCPEAEQFHREAISLPLYPGLTDAQQDYVVRSLDECLVRSTA